MLQGWELSESEKARLSQLEDAEVVLKQRPLKLFIEVPTGTREMPLVSGKRIYTLTLQVRTWSLGHGALKIQRCGFPIVPDFGGTAHAYCGSTMDAALGDCLSWFQKPTLEQMLRAYIIKSRIRETEKMLITQPYSPHLFRQGLLPGPSLLLAVLQKRMTTLEAKAEWKQHER